MMPELFRIPVLNYPLYSYGLMLVIGFYVALQLARFLARHSAMDPELFVTVGVIALVTGLLGARLSHVLENLPQYTRSDRSAWANFLDAVNFRSGGLTFYGGLILATFCCIAYGFWRRANVRVGMDIIAPCVMIGLGFGRVGCFLNGCCYGAECDVSWAVTYPYGSNAYVDEWREGKRVPPADLLDRTEDGARLKDRQAVAHDPELARLAATERSHAVHPAQLYSTFNAFLIAALCVAYYTLPHAPGRIFALMLMLDGFTRYILEMLRAEPPVVHLAGYGLSFSMVLGAGLFVAGVALWFIFGSVGGLFPAKRSLDIAPSRRAAATSA